MADTSPLLSPTSHPNDHRDSSPSLETSPLRRHQSVPISANQTTVVWGVDAPADSQRRRQAAPPTYQEAKRFGRHKSEAEYLEALRAWVESKQYIDAEQTPSRGLIGFYGDTTLQERSQKMKAERRSRKEDKQRARSEDASHNVKTGIASLGKHLKIGKKSD